jgi:hypothetical protein
MTLPRGIRLLYDPHLSHERLAAREHGAKSNREIDEDARIATDLLGSKLTDRLRLRGSWADGSAARDVARIMQHHGFLIDETDDVAASIGPFENNEGLIFRGVPPSVSNGGATVIGTGGDVDLADATDNSGRIVLSTGTGVSAAGTICTITFDIPKSNADYGVWFHAADNTAATAAGVTIYADFGSRTTTQFVVAATAILTSSVSYHWDYMIVERRAL